MKTKFTKEYAEKLAKKHHDHAKRAKCSTPFRIGLREGFERGYMKAIEETAAPELLEACIKMIAYYENGKVSSGISFLEEAIQKATQP